jgi:hypothetical protein
MGYSQHLTPWCSEACAERRYALKVKIQLQFEDAIWSNKDLRLALNRASIAEWLQETGLMISLTAVGPDKAQRS